MSSPNRLQTQLSYLYARDPSLITWNHPRPIAKKNLDHELNATYSQSTESQEKAVDTNIEVYLRVKNEPYDIYEIQNNTLVCKVPEGSQALRNVNKDCSMIRKYTFSDIFGPETTQTELFDSIIKSKMLSFINGHNNSILTYGASGSGKTFTVVGTSEDPGIVPRALEYLFRTIPHTVRTGELKPDASGVVTQLSQAECKVEKQICNNLLKNSGLQSERELHARVYREMQQRLSSQPVAQLDTIDNVSASVWVSYAEIYNESIHDLLQPIMARGKSKPMRLGNANGHVYIKNLTSVNVTSGLEAYQILQYGIQNLKYASTKINDHSSRSHSIFTIKLVQCSHIDGGMFVNYFNFCDLAGSERTKKTMNVGDRLKESNNINTSLLVLGRCINLVRNAQKQNNDKVLIPFRESKLTQLFQRALSGQENIFMIVNINPSADVFDETHHVLNFSTIASDITIIDKPTERKNTHKVPSKNANRFTTYMELQTNVAITNKMKDDAYEEKVEENQYLHNLIHDLQEEIEMLKIEAEENERLTRSHIINGYKAILADNDEAWQQRLDDENDMLKTKYDIKLENQKQHYEELLKLNGHEKEKAPFTDSIVIISDDSIEEDEVGADVEEEEEEEKEAEKSINDILSQSLTEKNYANANLQRELTALRLKCHEYEITSNTMTDKYNDLMKEVTQLKQTNGELMKTLSDATTSYQELQNESSSRYIRDQEKIDELTSTVEAHWHQLNEAWETIEDLKYKAEEALVTADADGE